MKYFKLIFSLFAISLMLSSCQEDDLTLDTIVVPSNLNITANISDDGSGLVDFTATADDAITYEYNFSDGTSAVAAGGTYTKRFTRVGLNTYLVTVVAYGKGGVSSSKSIEVAVQSDFDDPETKQFLTGGSSKTWYIASAVPGHLGVGQNTNDEGPIVDGGGFFAGAAGFGPDCFYDDTMTFSLGANDQLTYDYSSAGATFVNWTYTTEFGGAGQENNDECLEVPEPGTVTATLAPATSGIPEDQSTQTVIDLSGDAFVAYYIGTSQYEVLEITENSMYLRAIPGNDDFLAWYLILTTSPDGTIGDGGGEPDFESQFTNEIWSDEFEGDALDTDNWNYEIGNGTNGWGNNEAQYYTDSEDNVRVEDGNLVITARREAESGFDFTSARITTKDKFEFTYGRVEVRAKLPEGGGTWPAIWMLGAEWPEEAWPGVGEMDIMEWVGNQPDRVSSALHLPGNSGGNAIVGDVTGITDASTEFHIYEVEWTAEKITFLMDGVPHLEFDNDESTPFQSDFYLLLNIAMGGTLGGTIADDFQESSMEIDYVKVYQ
ncbi:family 16 glycosylhydrolase [Gramella lutea]|uniref:Family 16 glycosylhydrolase n=1 Tax=Christiangramia lutea TaxID=1607951 RepID=A0A9X1V1B2_9FLAO|nr:family 16 glycosylhydrolase [Christiangramia lutea]MCH4822274.1 family 16 glycosylhydrolase [Christiangramia lutea]